MRIGVVASIFLCLCATGCGQKTPEPIARDSTNIAPSSSYSPALAGVIRDSIQIVDSKQGPVICTVRRYGPFELRNTEDIPFRVFVEVGHVRFASMEESPFAETDYSYAFVGSDGKVLYRVSGPWGSGEDALRYEPVQLAVPPVGPLVLLMSRYAPTVPEEGLDGRLFGLDPLGEIVPYSGTLGPTGGSRASEFRPVLIKMTGENSTASEYATDGEGIPAIEVSHWTGYFTVHRLFAVWAKSSPTTMIYQTRYRIEIDSAEAVASRARHRAELEDSTVAVYARPSTSERVLSRMPIHLKSSIRFIDAVKQDTWWLHVWIDGVEGYVIEEDFMKLGLSPAG